MSDEKKRTCGAGPTSPWLTKRFEDLSCDRERGHSGAHHRWTTDGGDDWWLEGCIGVDERTVLEMLADAAADRLKEFKRAEREAKRAAKAKTATKPQPPPFKGCAWPCPDEFGRSCMACDEAKREASR